MIEHARTPRRFCGEESCYAGFFVLLGRCRNIFVTIQAPIDELYDSFAGMSAAWVLNSYGSYHPETGEIIYEYI